MLSQIIDVTLFTADVANSFVNNECKNNPMENVPGFVIRGRIRHVAHHHMPASEANLALLVLLGVLDIFAWQFTFLVVPKRRPHRNYVKMCGPRTHELKRFMERKKTGLT